MRIVRAIVCVCMVAAALAVPARGVYQEPDAFVTEAFGGDPPEPQRLWLTAELREQASAVLGHPPPALRVPYWRRGQRSVWLLEEIGKEKPITAGVVVDAGRIERVEVLIFREIRGWEVRYPFFTDQFRGARLTDERQLDRRIDGISGATLSVRAMEKIAELALLLHDRSAADDRQLSQAP